MTETEAQKWLERFEWDDSEETSEALATICEALQEYPKFREIGTVERLLQLQHDYWYLNETCKEYSAIGTVEELKTAMLYVSLAKKHGTVGKAIDACAEYESIGTIEEFKALKEKNEPKELAEHNFQDEVHHYLCPSCRSIVSCNQNYCDECGQALKT